MPNNDILIKNVKSTYHRSSYFLTIRTKKSSNEVNSGENHVHNVKYQANHAENHYNAYNLTLTHIKVAQYLMKAW